MDLKTNEFGLVNTDGSLLFPNQTSRREAPFPSGLGWKTSFYRRPVAFGEMIIFTTTSLGRTKILQFLPLRPPLGRTTKTCFCVGSDGYIRVERGSAHPSTHGYMILAHIKSQNRWYKQTSAKRQFLKTFHPLWHDTLCKTWKTKGYIANQISLVNISHKITSVVNISQCRAWSSYKSPLEASSPETEYVS